MMKSRLAYILLSAGLAGSCVCVHALDWGDRAEMPVPDGAKVTLRTDRTDYFLGENVLVHFALENTSDQPFKASFGGDYRGASRSLRFIVTATDEAGQLAEDPDTTKMCFGGVMGDREIKPGEKYAASLPLMRYCRIDKPGRYTVCVTHDFGWKEDDQRKRPVGEITLTFRIPTPDEAEAVVAAVDYSFLTQPVYLKPLLQRAEKGDGRALAGVGGIATREATEALINLSTNATSTVTKEAVTLLMMRLPKPENVKPPSFWVSYWDTPPFTREFRQHLVEQSWDASFVPAVHTLATNLLTRANDQSVASGNPQSTSGSFLRVQPNDAVTAGAIILQSIGTLDDANAVLNAMDKALDATVNPRKDPKDNMLDLPQPLRELANTMNTLKEKGYTVREGSLSGNVQIFLYFAWLAEDPQPRSARWLDLLDAFGTGSRYPIRIAALNSIPKPVPDECVKFVMGRLQDKDLGVCRVACEIAEDSGNKLFLKPVLEIIATEHEPWLLRQATETAKKLGAGYELLEILADRLIEENFYNDILRSLSYMILEDKQGMDSGRTDFSRSQRLALRNEWKKFLAQHADALRQGKKFKSGDPEIPPALFGRTLASD